MNSINVIGLDGQASQVEYTQGDSLMEVLREAGYEEIIAMCGGCCSCATCHVHIDKQDDFELAPVEEDEDALLSLADNYDADVSRLSCQVTLSESQDGMIVKIVEAD